VLRRWPLVVLTRVAAITSIVALLVMMYSVLFPKPLSVMASMSVGQLLGAFALGCYLLAVLGDVTSRARARRSLRPKAP
jgi:hypothetical protein